jgi:parvulin-like peptidyl-prolyl isomerase
MLLTLNSIGFSTSIAETTPSFSIETRVNDEVITNFDAEQRKLLLNLLNVNPKRSKSDIIKELIDERLQIQFAKNRRISFSEEQIEKQIVEFLTNRSITKNLLVKSFKKNGLDWESFKSYLANKAHWKKTLLQLYANKAKISEYELNLPQPTLALPQTRMINLSEIVIPFSERGKDKAILLAKRLQIELNAGSDFANGAKRFSRSQTAVSGGSLGFIDEKLLPEKIKNILLKLSINEITNPIILENRVVIFKLNERKSKITRPPLDYLMTFVTVSEKNTDGVAVCGSKDKYKQESILLSELNIERSQIFRSSELYEVSYLSSNTWVVLCNRLIDGEPKDVNQKKAIYFNAQMIKLSAKLMLRLYREAIIN